jgi:F-type H+-transporting ATPase subunit alpha
MLCVYTLQLDKASTVAQAVTTLEEKNALSYTVIVAANASPATTIFSSIHWCKYCRILVQGKATLIIYDDLTKQAQLIVKCHYYYVVHQVVKPSQEMYSIYIHVY